MTKYNNYAGEGGDGVNKLAILDPNATMVDPVTGASVMQEVMTIAGPTPDPEFIGTHPNAVKEWCINTAVVDPATDSILGQQRRREALPMGPLHEHLHPAGDTHDWGGRGVHTDADWRRRDGLRDQQRDPLCRR
jgi:hypothetical protein